MKALGLLLVERRQKVRLVENAHEECRSEIDACILGYTFRVLLSALERLR